MAFKQYTNFAKENPNSAQAHEATLKAGICLQKLGCWKESEEIFKGLISRFGNDRLGLESTFQMALSQSLDGRTSQALRISAPLMKTSLRYRTSLLHAWAHLQLGNWSQCAATLGEAPFDSTENLTETAQMMKIYAARGSHLPRRRPALAALFSAVLPGSGKWYAGKARDGFYSLLLIGSSAAVAASYGQDGLWAKSGFFGTMALFFHLGSIFGSAVEAQRFNHIQHQAFLSGLEETVHPEDWLWSFVEDDTATGDSPSKRSSFDMAETLFTSGKYEQAIVEYQRHLFYFPEDSRRDDAHYRIGLAYLNQRDWPRAREQFIEMKVEATTDALAFRSRLRLGQSYLSQSYPSESQLILRELLTKTQSAEEKSEVQYWLGICALQQGRWAEAADLFQGISQPMNNGSFSDRARQLAGVAREGYGLSRRSPALATGLSLILPGAGQIYSGRIWDGIFSLALNATAGYLTVDAFRDDRRLDGILLATLAWSRFYFGGLHNAARYSQEFNRKRKERHLQKHRELMQPKYLD